MHGAPIALIAATGVSGLFGFGIIQSAFSAQAQALFLVFAAVLVGMIATKTLFNGGAHGASHGHGKSHGGARARRHGGGHGSGHSHAHARGHGERGLLFSGRAVGAMMIASGALALIYFWTDNNLTAEKLGRAIDGGVASLSRQVQATVMAARDDARSEEEAAQSN